MTKEELEQYCHNASLEISNMQNEIDRLNKALEESITIINLKQAYIVKLSNIQKIMEKYFELIVDLGYDYDGFNTVESLKTLIDELCRYASLGRVCNTTECIFVNNNKKYNILNEELGEIE